MKSRFISPLSILCVAVPLSAADEVIDVSSGFRVEETADRLEGILKEEGVKVFEELPGRAFG
jgi:hypothetical protein